MLGDSSFWVLISFLLFVGLISYYRIPRKVMDALDKRGAGIGKELHEATALRQEAQNMLESYRRKQREVESEAEEILAQARREADRLVEVGRKEMELHTKRLFAMTEERIRQSQQRAEAELHSLAAEAVVQAARTILLEQAVSESGDATIEESIQALSKALPQGMKRAQDQ